MNTFTTNVSHYKYQKEICLKVISDVASILLLTSSSETKIVVAEMLQCIYSALCMCNVAIEQCYNFS